MLSLNPLAVPSRRQGTPPLDHAITCHRIAALLSSSPGATMPKVYRPLMNRLILVAISLGLLCCSPISSSLQAQQKIGTVDLTKVFDGYWRTKAFSEKIRQSSEETNLELQRRVAKFNKERDAYRKLAEEFNDAANNKELQDKLRPKLQQTADDLRILENDVNTRLQQERDRVARNQDTAKSQVLQEIRATVAQKAKAAGYDFVFDTSGNSANSAPTLLFHNERNDLTDAVLSQLNANAPTPTEETEKKEKEDKPSATKSETKPAAVPAPKKN